MSREKKTALSLSVLTVSCFKKVSLEPNNLPEDLYFHHITFFFYLGQTNLIFCVTDPAGIKNLTKRKKNEKGGVSNVCKLADPLPNRPLLAENMAV